MYTRALARACRFTATELGDTVLCISERWSNVKLSISKRKYLYEQVLQILVIEELRVFFRQKSVGWSRAALGLCIGGLGSPYGVGLGPVVGPLWAVLGRSWDLLSGFGSLLGPLLTVLGYVLQNKVARIQAGSLQAHLGLKVAQTQAAGRPVYREAIVSIIV